MTSENSILFPYKFIFRNREQLNEYITNKLTSNSAVYYAKLMLGIITLILPIFNIFTVYRSMIDQQVDFSNVYSTFHSIIFYGEFIEVHLFMLIAFILFIYHSYKQDHSLCPNKSRWLILIDLEFTLMAFNLIKLIPILGVTGFNLVFIQISATYPVFRKYSLSSQLIAFTVLILIVLIQLIFLLGFIILITLVKVYQLSFVGQIINPLKWTINQWLLFIGYAANIINMTDIPTISQLSFMWDIINRTWSDDCDMWLHDTFAAKRKVYIYSQILNKLGFIKAFLWIRTMTALDLHTLVRLPPERV